MAEEHPSSGYWYPRSGVSGVDVLNMMRRYREAEMRMRARTRASMKMNETDLLALRHLLKAQREGRRVMSRELADVLRISSASVTTLVDRLEKSGHVTRVRDERDRRVVYVAPTTDSDDEVRSTLGSMHQRMIAAVDGMTPEQLGTVAFFLDSMIAAIEEKPSLEAELEQMVAAAHDGDPAASHDPSRE